MDISPHVLAAKRLHTEALLRLPNVVAVGVGVRRTTGVDTGEPAVDAEGAAARGLVFASDELTGGATWACELGTVMSMLELDTPAQARSAPSSSAQYSGGSPTAGRYPNSSPRLRERATRWWPRTSRP